MSQSCETNDKEMCSLPKGGWNTIEDDQVPSHLRPESATRSRILHPSFDHAPSATD